MKTGAVIVAAGMSSRMKDFKPMLPMGENSIIKRVVQTLKKADVSPIVVITGHNAKQLERHLLDQNVICIYNPDYEKTDMFASAKIGMQYLQGKSNAILFTPADVPLFTVNTVKQLMQADGLIAKPVCNGRGGHPLFLKEAVFSPILNYTGGGGLKGALQALKEPIQQIQVEDAGILYDADTPADYQKLLDYYNRK